MTQYQNPLSAGVVVVRQINGEWHYLLLRAYQHWDFPKGLVEQGEDALDAAQREVEEETTLNSLVFRWGYSFQETAPYGKMSKIARYYVAESPQGDVDLPISPELGHPEHEEFRWLSYQEVYQRVTPRVQSILEWARSIINA